MLPLSRISRAEEMFRASRKSVNNSRVVGKTLNSTGRVIYIATIITITDIMMSATIRMSSTNPGNGVISAMTIARTAMGTVSSLTSVRLIPPNPFHIAGAVMAFVSAKFSNSL